MLNRILDLFPNSNLSNKKSILFHKSKYFYVSIIIPSIISIILVYSYGVNILYWDEWDEIGELLLHLKANGFNLKTFWEQHNEHRIFLPKLIIYFNIIFNYSHINLMILTQIILLFSAIVSFSIAVFKNVELLKSKYFKIYILLISFFMFSTTQYENFFWGFQLAWIMYLFAGILSIHYLTIKNYFFSILFFVIAYVSMSSWLSLVPTYILFLVVDMFQSESSIIRKKRFYVLLTAIILLTFFLVLYFFDYIFPVGNNSYDLVLFKPLDFVIYFFSLLGVPFRTFGKDITLLMGVLYFLLLILMIIVKRMKKNSFIFYSCLWVMFSALLLSFGRSNFGLTSVFAFGSRYSSLIIIGWAMMFIFHWIEFRSWSNRVVNFLICCLIAYVHFAHIPSIKDDYKRKLEGKKCLINLLMDSDRSKETEKNCLKNIFPNSEFVLERSRQLIKNDLFYWN